MKLLVHQALHGYRDGHRLLASSNDLSRADRQVLAIQTDNSDAGRDSEWTSLLSGYPLPSGLYAWSMTWPAPEMPRPGCVWTHTLLLDPLDDVLCSRCDIPSLFRRPREDVDTSLFGKPFEPTPVAEKSLLGSAPKGGAQFLIALLWSFYEPPLRPVRVTGIPWGDRERHRLLTSLWVQQWAELRARSSFTDAPITPRHLGEASYDLQLHRSSRAQQRRDDQRVLSGVPTDKPPHWAHCATRDLLHPDGLRVFLHAYGPEAGADRGCFSALAGLWALGEDAGADRGRRALTNLAHLYPEPDAGKTLKQDILDTRSGPEGWSSPLGDEEVLLGGLEANAPGALPLELYDADRRVRSVLKGRPQAMAPILAAIKDESEPLAAQLLDSLAAAPSGQLERWLKAEPTALDRLLILRPEIAASPVLWKLSKPDRVWSAIAGLHGKQRRGKALSAMLASDAELDPAKVLASWNGSEDLLLDRIAAELPRKQVAERWLSSLPGGAIARWVNGNAQVAAPQALRLILGSVEPHELARTDPEIVLAQLESSKSQELTASIFVAAINSSKKPEWAPLAVLSFERLCAPSQRYPRLVTKYLEQLESDFPKGASWPQKLARCLNLAFQDDRWDPLEALSLKPPAFRLLLAADKRAGLARRISSAGAETPELLEAAQTKILLRNIKERSDAVSLFEWGEALARKVWPF